MSSKQSKEQTHKSSEQQEELPNLGRGRGGDRGQGYDEESGAPKTVSGEPDMRYKQARETYLPVGGRVDVDESRDRRFKENEEENK